jgi:hypothetical protein
MEARKESEDAARRSAGPAHVVAARRLPFRADQSSDLLATRPNTRMATR